MMLKPKVEEMKQSYRQGIENNILDGIQYIPLEDTIVTMAPQSRQQDSQLHPKKQAKIALRQHPYPPSLQPLHTAPPILQPLK